MKYDRTQRKHEDNLKFELAKSCARSGIMLHFGGMRHIIKRLIAMVERFDKGSPEKDNKLFSFGRKKDSQRRLKYGTYRGIKKCALPHLYQYTFLSQQLSFSGKSP